MSKMKTTDDIEIGDRVEWQSRLWSELGRIVDVQFGRSIRIEWEDGRTVCYEENAEALERIHLL